MSTGGSFLRLASMESHIMVCQLSRINAGDSCLHFFDSGVHMANLTCTLVTLFCFAPIVSDDACVPDTVLRLHLLKHW